MMPGKTPPATSPGGPRRGWRSWLLAGLLLVLVVVNAGIWRNEAVLRSGQVVLLQLAPVDPRSLMQGDYMALRFALEGEIEAVLQRGGGGEQGEDVPAPAYAVLSVDARRVATFQRLQSSASPLLDGEVALRYEWRDGRVDVAPGAFFFEEGRGGHFAAAQYGELRIAPDGRALLSGLRDVHLAPL